MYLFRVFIVLGLFGLEVSRMNLKMAPIAGLVFFLFIVWNCVLDCFRARAFAMHGGIVFVRRGVVLNQEYANVQR